MSLVLMVLLGFGVWAVAYGPIEPPSFRAVGEVEQGAAQPALMLLTAAAADPAETETMESDAGLKSLTGRPSFG